MTDLSYDLERVGDVSVVRLSGDLDVESAPDVILLADDVVSRPGLRELVIDMAAVGFMDSSGTGALVRARNLCLTNGVWVRLRGVRPRVRKVLDITGLSTVFDLD